MSDRYDGLYGSRYDEGGNDYGRRNAYEGMRSSDAAGGYRRADDDVSRYSRDSYVGEQARYDRRDRGGEEPAEEQHRGWLDFPGYAREDRSARESAEEAAPVQREAAGDDDRSRLREAAAARLAKREARRDAEASAAPTREPDPRPTPEPESEPAPKRAASRADDVRSHYSRTSDSYVAKQPSKRKRMVGIVLGVIAALALVAVGVGFAYTSGIMGKLHQGMDDVYFELTPTDMANEPFYVLLIGTDASSDREEDESFGGQFRADSMILARVDPVNNKVAMVSIPRDTLVQYGENDWGKINEAYGRGGAAEAVDAVKKLTGVNINHYAEVNFDGFAALVDAVGGVEVDVPVDIDDWEAGGAVSAGLQTLNGEQALILCRSRNTYINSAAPDLMRAANQRLVLSAIARKVLDSDLPTIAGTVNSVVDYVRTTMNLNDIIGLAQRMHGLDADNDIYTATFPTTSAYISNGYTYASIDSTQPNGTVDISIDAAYYELPDEQAWAVMKKRMENGEPPSEGLIVDEATGTVLATAGADAQDVTEKYSTVMIKNATDIKGVATKMAKELQKVGFQNVVVGEINDNYKYPETLVIYDNASKEYEAELIVKTMGQGKAMKNNGEYLFETDFLVIIGDDWKTESDS